MSKTVAKSNSTWIVAVRAKIPAGTTLGTLFWACSLLSLCTSSSAHASDLPFLGWFVESGDSHATQVSPDQSNDLQTRFEVTGTFGENLVTGTISLTAPQSWNRQTGFDQGTGKMVVSVNHPPQPILLYTNVLEPRLSQSPGAEAWSALMQTSGVGAWESTSNQTSEVDWLFDSPGRVDGPTESVELSWVNATIEAEVDTQSTHLILPIRIGVSQLIDGNTMDKGRSRLVLAIYGSPITGELNDLHIPSSNPTKVSKRDSHSTDGTSEQVTRASLVERWLLLAEPVSNATEYTDFRYDEWGRTVGIGIDGETRFPEGTPDDAQSMTPADYAWQQRTQLDSVHHCTLEDFVTRTMANQSIADCANRFKEPEPFELPAFAGQTTAQAVASLQSLELAFEIVDLGPSPDAARSNTIVDQDPKAGEIVKPRSHVQLRAFQAYVPPPTKLADVRGLLRDDALAEIRALGFKGKVRNLIDATERSQSGRVKTQSPSPGELLKAKSTVSIDVFREYVPSLQERASAGNAKAQFQLSENFFYGRNGTTQSDKSSFAWASRSAEQGHSSAQFRLGYLYAKGRGVEKNSTLAAKWYEQAANQGSAPAANNLGTLYKYGRGVKKDLRKAYSLFKQAAEKDNKYGQWNQGVMLRDGLGVKEQHDLAASLFKKAAEADLRQAQRDLAECYQRGRGINKNLKLAAEWYRKAADAGDSKSQLALGNMYRDGEGVPKNRRSAFNWYEKAVASGNSDAVVRLASCYRHGLGTTKDAKKAFDLYVRAAQKGNESAQYTVGRMYQRGQGTRKSEASALRWWKKAAESGHRGSMFKAGQQYLFGQGTKRDYKQATKWLEAAARKGHAGAANDIGRCSEFGWGYKQDIKRAVEWYERAYELGSMAAATNLGRLREAGNGVRKSHKKAAEYYQPAAEKNYAYAQYRLGVLYRDGKGVRRDKELALKWLREAADRNEQDAMYELGEMYRKGKGVKRDYKPAAQWYRKAAKLGHAESQYELGRLYEDGKGVPENMTEARRWWRKAAKQGHEDAKDELE